MKLTAKLKLQPTSEQFASLLATLAEANHCCNAISETAYRDKVFRQYPWHQIVYKESRRQFNLSAQMVVRAIGKVADSYKSGRQKQRGFSERGAFPYDARILSFKLAEQRVSIWTVAGRQQLPYTGSRQALARVHGERGESDLCFVRGRFYLLVACEVETAEPLVVDEYLGVDMGIVNIASDSDGQEYSGQQLLGLRGRRYRQRKRLQRKGTKSARRVLRRLKGRERRMGQQENHRIAKEIVSRAQRTGRGIAIEALGGIRDRVRVRRSQRRQLHGWSFSDLAQKIGYKAELAGVPVRTLDPAYSSQTCAACDHCEKGNRLSQSHFRCRACGHADNADSNAARVLSGWAVHKPAVRLSAPTALG